ncbi:MAG: hypothetical protein KDD42_09685, partial [Bdellovibrionales bacterium]|nr:hypothetical protein [Bdellovibrionales bacterium]
LPQHTKFTGILGTGILEIEKSEGGSQRMVISGGVCTFVAGTFTVLADSADTLDSVDRENYSAERQELKQLVDQGKTLDPEWAVARAKLARIEAIDELIAH